MARKLTVGAGTGARLFTQRFAADSVLANFTDAAFQILTLLSAHHASFFRFSHKRCLSALAPFASIDQLDLLGMFEDHLQAILRVIFNKSGQFHFAVFKILWLLLTFFEKLGDGAKNHRRQGFA